MQRRLLWHGRQVSSSSAKVGRDPWSLRRCHRNCSSKEKCWMWEVKFIQFILRHGNKILSDNLIGFGTSDTFDIPLYKEHWHVLQNLKTCLWSLCLILSRGQLLLRSITSSSCLIWILHLPFLSMYCIGKAKPERRKQVWTEQTARGPKTWLGKARANRDW